MNYQELRTAIKTGDYGLCQGTQAAAKVIEFLTGLDSHVFKFVWIGDGLWCAEEWEEIGFQLLPASLKLQYYWDMNPGGVVKLGIAPDIVRSNPQAGMGLISTYRVDKNLRPYGGMKTFAEIAASELGWRIDPMKVQAVCSTFCQQYDIACGMKYDRLFAPSDFEKVAVQIVEIERG